MNENPLFILKPVFIPWLALAQASLISLFFSLFPTFFLFFAINFLNAFLSHSFGPKGTFGTTFPYFFSLFGVIYLGFTVWIYLLKKKTYVLSEYRFFAAQLEYVEGFWTRQHKIVEYSRVAEVTWRQGVVQRAYGLCSIHLATAGESIGQGRELTTGIDVSDVEGGDEIFQKVMVLIKDNANKKNVVQQS